MKYTGFILLYFLFVSCSEQEEKDVFIPAQFDIDSTSITFNYSLIDVIQYSDGYLCCVDTHNKDSLSLVYLDRNYEFDSIKSSLLNKDIKFPISEIWTSNGNLFVLNSRLEILTFQNEKWLVTEEFQFDTDRKHTYFSYEKHFPIYEDEDYIVRSCCSGEFGGAVFFTNKKTKKVYSCEATCLASIEKVKDVYYLASCLPHGDGRSSIITIDDPSKLFEIKEENQLNDCSWYDIYSEDWDDLSINHPKGFDNGYKDIIDTIDLLILGMLTYENHPYFIYSNFDESYIGYLDDNQLKTIDTIYKKPMWYGAVRDIKHNQNLFAIRNRIMKGMLIIKDNRIKIIEFKNSN
ncbi:MAG: hypothetical protein COA99_17700 [Moraxellaceae bacterium]|nr:MAG: hypothetical protein COA99_17700 [Moraxellaceae bacterium]